MVFPSTRLEMIAAHHRVEVTRRGFKPEQVVHNYLVGLHLLLSLLIPSIITEGMLTSSLWLWFDGTGSFGEWCSLYEMVCFRVMHHYNELRF